MANTLEIEVIKVPGKPLGRISVPPSARIKDVKEQIKKDFNIHIERQSIRLEQGGKDVPDATEIGSKRPTAVYVKDLGPQIGYDTVFYLEYAGPIFLYLALMILPHCFYNSKAVYQGGGQDVSGTFPFNFLPIAQINRICGGSVIRVQDTAYYAGILWTIHYVKRILETAFVHRFSHGTMPIFNLFKNCGYYWGFALFVAYHINHPLHTAPPGWIFYPGVLIFIFCEIGNLSIHLLLRDLRPPGTSVRKIPLPNGNPFTLLFNLVSCPNYTYEFGAWIGFMMLTSCLPVFLFALAGLYQMTIWAIGKHKKYRSEFSNYPRNRKAIIPFVI